MTQRKYTVIFSWFYIAVWGKYMNKYLKLKLALLWLVISFGICFLNQGTLVSQEKDDALTKALNSITNQDVEKRIGFIASPELEGRFTGEPGLKMAAKYAEDEFKKDGLKPVGDNHTYFQGLELPAFNNLDGTPKLAVNGKECNTNDFSVFDFSGEGKIEAPIVFAGYGITAPMQKYDDYAGLDVKGKIVLIFRYAPRWQRKDVKAVFPEVDSYLVTKYNNARKHGAAGLLIFTGPLQEDKGNPCPLTTTMSSHLDLGMEFKKEDKLAIPAFYITPDIAKEILKNMDIPELQKNIDDKIKPISFPIKETKISFELKFKKVKKTTENVVGFLEGSDPKLKDEVVIIGAHYDHVGQKSLLGFGKGICAGADDNGSGTVAVLELAEAFSLLPQRPKRSILFILFTAEEIGLLGAAYYIQHPIFPIDKTYAVLNMDMIGRPTGEKTSVKVYGGGGCELFKKVCNEMAEKENVQARLTRSAAVPSDAFVFYSKIPTIWFFASDMKGYHSPKDTPDNILVPKMTVVVRYIFRIAYELSNTEARPVLSASQTKVRFGIFPEEVKGGVEIRQVIANSAAAKAGLKQGDIVTKITRGGREGSKISNLEEFLDIISTLQPGEEVTLEILRNGKTEVLKIIPDTIKGE